MRAAIVSGASSGIGAAITRRLLAEGWRVLGLSRSEPPFRHQNFVHAAVDLGRSDFAIPAHPPVDAVIHAAGILRLDRIGEPDGDGPLMWQLHVNAATRLVHLAVPAMPDGGRIILLGSRASRGAANRAQYAASKAALLGLAKSWALELVPRRITVNIISPAATNTAMQFDPARAAVKPRLPPFGALIEPGEIAGLAAFLLGEEARNITGQEIFVCGGASL